MKDSSAQLPIIPWQQVLHIRDGRSDDNTSQHDRRAECYHHRIPRNSIARIDFAQCLVKRDATIARESPELAGAGGDLVYRSEGEPAEAG